MPTSRPRHTITETDHIAEVLDEAAEHWPAQRDERGRLLVHLVEEGYRAVRRQREQETRRRREAVRRTSGALTGVYEPGYLAGLRDEWPE